MKKIFIVLMASLFFAAPVGIGYCQSGSGDDAAIEQSESQIGQGLDSEISSDRSQSEAEVSQVDSSMNTGGDGR